MVREASLIWETNFFKKLHDGGTQCNICAHERCKACKKTPEPCKLTGQHASNAKKHLKAYHSKQSAEYEEFEASKQLPTPSTLLN